MIDLHLQTRNPTLELIDAPVADAHALSETFADMERFNFLFGGIAPVCKEISRSGARHVLDVGCGSAQIPRALVRGARRRNVPIRITCLDVSDSVLHLAAERSATYPELSFCAGTADALPFADKSFDAAICTLALHHRDPVEAVTLLTQLRRVAETIVVTDLRRCIGGLFGAYAISRLLSQNRLTRNDAPLSVRRAYTGAEVIGLARRSGWRDPRVVYTPFFRLMLTDAA